MAFSSPILLLRVATTWPLPGLGLLAMPAGPTPHLTSLPLHTALPVDLHLPDGSRRPAVGTVEELNRAGAEAMRGLLLDAGPDRTLPPGTFIWLRDPAPDIW